MNLAYNQTIIDKNPQFRNLKNNQVERLLSNRTVNLEDSEFEMNYYDLITLSALDNHIAKKICNGERIIPNSIEDTYLKQLAKELKKQPLLIYSLPLCRISSQVLAKYIPGIEDIRKKCIQQSEDTKRIRQKMINGQATPEEMNQLIKFYNYYISYYNVEKHDEEFFKPLVKYLLNCVELGFQAMSFVLKYFGYKNCIKENLGEIPILFGKPAKPTIEGVSLNAAIVVNKSKMTRSSFLDNTLIEFKARRNGRSEGFNLLHTIYHELRHSMQDRDMYSKRETDLAFSMSAINIIKALDDEEYKRNYSVYDIEADANRYGYRRLVDTIRELFPNRKDLIAAADEKFYKYAIRKNFDFRTEKDRKFSVTGSFIKHKLDEFFKLHPETLETTYSHFKKFYTSDGSPVSLTSFLSTEYSSECNGFIFNQAVARFRDQEPLDVAQIDGLSLDKKHDMVVNIRLIIGEAYRKISFCKDRMTMNSHINVGDIYNSSKIGGIDEDRLLSINCGVYCRVAKGYANILSNLLKKYPELKPNCEFSIDQVNTFLRLIEKDINEINGVIDDSYRIEIPQMPVIGNGDMK